MTEFHVEVIKVQGVQPHPNADTLSICTVHSGYPVVFKTGAFSEGDLAVYVPVDAVLPDVPEYEFLGKHKRIRAKKLRGVFSMGMLIPAPTFNAEGEDVAECLGITKYETPEDYRGASQTDGLQVPAPQLICPHYDLEGYRRNGSWFEPEDQVVITEKIHGQNFRAVWSEGKLHIGSRTRWLDPESDCTWAKVARKYNLAEQLAHVPGLVIFGESYGNNADMPYGVERAKNGDALAVFDIWDSEHGRFVDYDDLEDYCAHLGLLIAPVLHRGKVSDVDLVGLAEGPSTLALHVREGWVMRPIQEEQIGHHRKILKMHGQGYLTR